MLKQIDKKAPLAKYCQISDSIREKIKSGSFAEEEKLPTCRNLASYFGTTVNTVMKAVDVLESEGYIYKVQGKGIFAKKPTVRRRKKVQIKRIGQFVPINADLYQNITDEMVSILHNFDYELVPFGNIFGSKMTVEEKELSMKKVIERNFDALIINGERHFNYKLLHKYKDHLPQITFIAHCESALDFKEANRITADYEKIGYLGADYLIKKDIKKILFISYEKLPLQQYKSLGTKTQSSDIDVLNGMKRALKENKLELDIEIVRDELNNSSSQKAINTIEQNLGNGNLGVMTMGDSRALDAYNVVKNSKFEFGKDCSIVGLFNTPWTEILTPKLTSISIREREIGRLAAEAIIGGWKGKRILVEPELIVRET